MKIVMVCLGNICRSPVAEGILRHKLSNLGIDSISTDSAGTSSYHIGEAPDRRMRATSLENGVNIDDLRARQFVPSDYDDFDISKHTNISIGDGFYPLTERIIGVQDALNSEIQFSETEISEISRTKSFGFSADITAKTGFELGKIDFGAELKVGGKYDQKELQTFTTSFSTTSKFVVDFPIVTKDAEYKYSVKPYIYWTQNGAFVLDYSVDLPTDSETIWKKHYSSLPDLSFILPHRLDTEKGIIDIDNKYKTTDIIFKPKKPEPGDTVTILTRVHNFSLATLENDTVDLKFYLGDPDEGATRLQGIYYQHQYIENYDITVPRGYTYVESRWIVPSEIPNNPRIYCVLDSANIITEIHEDNNKGWVIIPIDDPTSIGANNIKNVPTEYKLSQNYPNPFNPTTTIEYQLTKPGKVTLYVYNILGQKVKELVNNVQSAGSYKVQFNANNFSSGVYFYEFKSGEFKDVNKLILLK